MPTLPSHASDEHAATPPAPRAAATSASPALRVADDVAIRAPARLVEAEPDYRSPTPRERARLLRAAWEGCAGDPEQRLLLAELMAHYRSFCVRRGLGDPFSTETALAVPAVAGRAD